MGVVRPLAVKLTGVGALGAPLWIRRVLVRGQEGQLEARCDDPSCRASSVSSPFFAGSGESCSMPQIELKVPHDLLGSSLRRAMRTSPSFLRTDPDIFALGVDEPTATTKRYASRTRPTPYHTATLIPI